MLCSLLEPASCIKTHILTLSILWLQAVAFARYPLLECFDVLGKARKLLHSLLNKAYVILQHKSATCDRTTAGLATMLPATSQKDKKQKKNSFFRLALVAESKWNANVPWQNRSCEKVLLQGCKFVCIKQITAFKRKTAQEHVSFLVFSSCFCFLDGFVAFWSCFCLSKLPENYIH